MPAQTPLYQLMFWWRYMAQESWLTFVDYDPLPEPSVTYHERRIDVVTRMICSWALQNAPYITPRIMDLWVKLKLP